MKALGICIVSSFIATFVANGRFMDSLSDERAALVRDTVRDLEGFVDEHQRALTPLGIRHAHHIGQLGKIDDRGNILRFLDRAQSHPLEHSQGNDIIHITPFCGDVRIGKLFFIFLF